MYEIEKPAQTGVSVPRESARSADTKAKAKAKARAKAKAKAKAPAQKAAATEAKFDGTGKSARLNHMAVATKANSTAGSVRYKANGRGAAETAILQRTKAKPAQTGVSVPPERARAKPARTGVVVPREAQCYLQRARANLHRQECLCHAAARLTT